MTRLTLIGFTLALATPALADPPRPRVMVILDTSKSMKERPSTASQPWYDQTDPGGDYDPNNPVTCANKFCSAKQAVHAVIPNFTDDARIGLTTYFQYVVNANRRSTENTVCHYDVIAPPGLQRSYFTYTDILPSASICSSFPSVGGCTGKFTFPEGSGGGGRLKSYCDTPSGYGSLGATCPAGSPNCYDVYKTAVADAGIACVVTTHSSKTGMTFPYNVTGSSHCATGTYTAEDVPARVGVTGTNRVRKYVSAGTTTCSGTPDPESAMEPPGGNIDLTINTAVTLGALPSAPTLPTVGTTYSPGGNISCSPNHECNFYLYSATPTPLNTSRHWYTFFTGAPTATMNNASWSGLSYKLSDTSGAYGTTQTFTGYVNGVSACTPSVTNGTTGDLSGYGFGDLPTQLAAGPIAASSSTEESPTISSTTYTCAPDLPCSVTLTNDTVIDAGWSVVSTVYDNSTPLPSNQRYVAKANQGGFSAASTSSSINDQAAIGLSSVTCPTIDSSGALSDTANFTMTGSSTTASCPTCTYLAPTKTYANTTCSATVFRNAATPVPTCAANGRTYSSGGSVTYYPVKEQAAGTTCTTGTVSLANSGIISGACGSWPCTATYLSTTQGARENIWVSQASNPAGYLANATPPERDVSPTVSVVSNVDENAALNCGATRQTISGGYYRVARQQVAPTGCGTENGPCYGCVAIQIEREFERFKVNCNYSSSQYQFNVDRKRLVCDYKRKVWDVEQQNPPLHNCTYQTVARRYDFAQPAMRYCEYWGIKKTIIQPRTQYTYKYLSKGTEIIGRKYKTGTNGLLCSAPYAGALAAACPATLTGTSCTGLVDDSTPSVGTSPYTTCVLSYGGGGSGSTIGLANGRYSSYFDDSRSFDANRACEADNTALPASRDSYIARASTPAGFCSQSGQPAMMTRTLMSDWYDPTVANDAGVFAMLYPPSSYDVTTHNTQYKRQGYGGAAADAGVDAVQGTVATQNALFVPIPDDTVYNDVTQAQRIRDAMSRCVLPSEDGGYLTTGRLVGGACMSDTVNPSAPGTDATCQSSGCQPGLTQCCSNNAYKACTNHSECWPWQDFTPLYGSLRNTYDYLVERWNTDNAAACRDYYIILATDGDERTPLGANLRGSNPATDIEALVRSFRSNGTTSPDVKTFIIAFGANITIGDLNAVADAGGTEQAFTATSLGALQTALQSVFTTISQGVYTRSRPALSTDGRRLYQAQYIKPSNSPDWSGLLTAYGVANDGTFGAVWEHSDKLNNFTGARSVKVTMRRISDNVLVTQTFDTSNTELINQIRQDPYFPDGSVATAQSVVDFILNPTASDAGGAPYWNASPPANRKSKLGPIVTSAPIVVAKSPYDTAWGGATSAQATGYQAFISSTTNRSPRVLFQANDGFLHAVKEGDTASPCDTDETDQACANGHEAWAWMPGTLQGRYESPYGRRPLTQHLYKLKQGAWSNSLLDNTVSVFDVCGPNANDATCADAGAWKTVAFGSQRFGGRGLYAVDVTVPTDAGPTFLWDYHDGDLGLTYSVPTVARVTASTSDQYVLVFGGGLDDPNTTGLGQTEGEVVYVLNSVTGGLVQKFTTYLDSTGSRAIPNQVLGRPVAWRRTGQSVSDSMYLGVGQQLMAMRFRDAPSNGSAAFTNSSQWTPREFFDPTSNRNRQRSGADMPVNRVLETTNPDGGAPFYTLSFVKNLPLTNAEAPPILNRPRMAPFLVSSGVVPDLYVGTGDVTSPDNPRSSFTGGNYFYAIHDSNLQAGGTTNDGFPLWVVKFPNKEQVVSEPAIINGCIVVATYTPPAVASVCGIEGDTTLYGFHPTDGTLTTCLNYPAGSPYADQATSVVKMPGAGIPSDLVVVNENVYFATSAGGLQRAPVRVTPRAGSVRSYRRIK